MGCLHTEQGVSMRERWVYTGKIYASNKRGL